MNQLQVSTLVIDGWPYYEFEKYIKKLNEKNENEKKHHEDSEKNQPNIPNMNSIGNLAKSFNPSNYKLPNFNSPF